MNMTTLKLSLAAFVVLGLGACSARDCGSDAPYLDLTQTRELVVPEDVNLPPGSTAYAIPNGGDGELVQSREYTDGKGKTRTACLYEPPRYVIESNEDTQPEASAEE